MLFTSTKKLFEYLTNETSISSYVPSSEPGYPVCLDLLSRSKKITFPVKSKGKIDKKEITQFVILGVVYLSHTLYTKLLKKEDGMEIFLVYDDNLRISYHYPDCRKYEGNCCTNKNKFPRGIMLNFHGWIRNLNGLDKSCEKCKCLLSKSTDTLCYYCNRNEKEKLYPKIRNPRNTEYESPLSINTKYSLGELDFPLLK